MKYNFVLLDRLKDQAVIFDMDIDYETFSLVPKRVEPEQPQWLTNYLNKLEQSDYMPDGSDDQEYDNE